MADSSSGRTSTIQLAILALIVLAFIAVLVMMPGGKLPAEPQVQQNETTISLEQFQSALLGARKVDVVMDLRSIPGDNASNAVMQCGVNLVFSLSQINKSVDSYAYDKSGTCYASSGKNATIAECEGAMAGDYKLIIQYGASDTKLYTSKAVISTNEFYGSNCFIQVEQTAEPRPPWELVDPNATAKNANKSFSDIFGGCLAAEACMNKTTTDERDGCLKVYALNAMGDAKCCFGFSNVNETYSCILSGAGLTHGISADYCQFMPTQVGRDECYYKYGTNYYYFDYCDRIFNSSMKAECLVALSNVGALPSQIAKSKSNSS